MTKEQHFFIELLSDHLAGKATLPRADLDWAALKRMGQQHAVGGIIYYQCMEWMPSSEQKFFAASYYYAIQNYVKRQQDWEEIKEAFQRENIECFIVKGLPVSAYYPVPELRTMGDTDVVIHSEDRDKVDEALQKNGFICELRPSFDWHYTKDKQEYEIHVGLLYEEEVNTKPLINFFNQCWNYACDKKLDPSFHFLFLLVHLRKHMMLAGVGFRQFLDVAVMGSKEDRLDWDWINEKLSELGMQEFAATCFGFIKAWFGISLPAETKVITPEFYETGTEVIFSNGVFGFDNPDNEANGLVNKLRKQNRQKSTVSAAISTAFPPYRTMKHNYPYSNYLAGRPYLLPVAYVHRMYRAFIHLSHPASRRRMPKMYASQEKIKERDAFLKQWGL